MRRYQRSLDVVWRLHDHRVLVRRATDGVESHADDAANDLVGAAARIWVAAEAPLTTVELTAEAGVTVAAAREAIDLLLMGGWLTEMIA